MGTLANGEVVAPFANAAMRLLREDWKGKRGAKMLAEELFPILQTDIPRPDKNFQNFITINAGQDDQLVALIDKFGNKVYEIDAQEGLRGGLRPVEPANYPPAKLKPRIVWAAKSINAGESLSGTQLDAVAVDPETGAEVAGVYVYTPPSGTTFASAGTNTIYVNFTPTDGVKYRRSMGNTVLTVVGVPVSAITFIATSNSASGISDPGTTTTDDTTDFTVQVGDLLVAFVGTLYSDEAPDGFAVVDSRGHTYTQVGSYARATLGGNLRSAIGMWYTVATVPGVMRAHATWDGPVGGGDVFAVVMAQYRGAHALPLRGSASSQDDSLAGGATFTGGIVPAAAGDAIMFGFVGVVEIAGYPSGYVNRDATIPFSFDRLAVSGPNAASGTISPFVASSSLVSIGAAFKPA